MIFKEPAVLKISKINIYHKTISIDELARTTPVKPPNVNKNTKPKDHKQGAL